MRNLKKQLLSNFLLIGIAPVLWAGQMSGSDFVITKDLFGATGPANAPAVASADEALSFAWGEPVSGDVISEPTYTIISGYFGGRFGNAQTFSLLSSQVGSPGVKTFYQGQLQMGVAYDAPIVLTFSDPLDDTTVAGGIQISVAADHLGRPSDAGVAVTLSDDSSLHTLTLHPQGTWLGNTLYDVHLSPSLLSVDGFQLDQPRDIYFVTLLDHHEENIVQDPIAPMAAAAESSSAGALSIDIPVESLSNYSAVLLSQDPLTAPLRVDPKIIQEANAKAHAAGGDYRVPLSIQEITAYDTNGTIMGPLSKPARVSMTYDVNAGASGVAGNIIRPQTLSLWVLDEEHRLWVKLPASQNTLGLRTITAPAGNFSVYALMGSPDGSAGDSFAFPVPWRPHGPNAGSGAGQSGSEADGITFSNLPSECSIKIYTISGDLVRTLSHSDTSGHLGQEKWDVRTAHGDPAASGVYLWRVESSVDGKNGKVMVIR